MTLWPYGPRTCSWTRSGSLLASCRGSMPNCKQLPRSRSARALREKCGVLFFCGAAYHCPSSLFHSKVVNLSNGTAICGSQWGSQLVFLAAIVTSALERTVFQRTVFQAKLPVSRCSCWSKDSEPVRKKMIGATSANPDNSHFLATFFGNFLTILSRPLLASSSHDRFSRPPLTTSLRNFLAGLPLTTSIETASHDLLSQFPL